MHPHRFHPDKATGSEDGPPIHIRIPSEKLVRLLKSHGFETTAFKLNSDTYAIKAKMVSSDSLI